MTLSAVSASVTPIGSWVHPLAETAKLRTASRAELCRDFRPFRRSFSCLTQRVRSIQGYSQPRMIFSAGFAAFSSDYGVVILRYLSSNTLARSQHFEFLRAMLRRNSCRTTDLQVPSMSAVLSREQVSEVVICAVFSAANRVRAARLVLNQITRRLPRNVADALARFQALPARRHPRRRPVDRRPCRTGVAG